MVGRVAGGAGAASGRVEGRGAAAAGSGVREVVSGQAGHACGRLVLDGGLSNQLADAGHDLSDALWSARLLADEPEAIVRAHAGYFAAGAEVAITASYQASFEGFARRGVGRAAAAGLLGL